jgi:hypothetical protein
LLLDNNEKMITKPFFVSSYLVVSRDLDSTFTQRERSAVNAWLATKKAFDAPRNHSKHRLRMLDGIWSFSDITQSILNVFHPE